MNNLGGGPPPIRKKTKAQISSQPANKDTQFLLQAGRRLTLVFPALAAEMGSLGLKDVLEKRFKQPNSWGPDGQCLNCGISLNKSSYQCGQIFPLKGKAKQRREQAAKRNGVAPKTVGLACNCSHCNFIVKQYFQTEKDANMVLTAALERDTIR